MIQEKYEQIKFLPEIRKKCSEVPGSPGCFQGGNVRK